MQHIEEAGIHSGDSACSIPSRTLTKELKNEIVSITKKLAIELKVIGLMNVQYAIKIMRFISLKSTQGHLEPYPM